MIVLTINSHTLTIYTATLKMFYYKNLIQKSSVVTAQD